MNRLKLLRVSTVPISLNILLKGQLRFLSQHFEVVGVSSGGSDLTQTQEREGITTLVVEMQRSISPLKDLIALFKMYKVLKREKPLIVHSITPKAGLVSMLAAKAAGVPIRMHTFTGLVFPSRGGIMQQILIKTDQLLCWAATHVYPEGKGVKEDLMKFNITRKPLKIIANGNVNGIDISFFNKESVPLHKMNHLKQEWRFDKDNFIFIFVGRLVKDKGINELILAFKALSATENRIKLLLVGNFEPDLDPLLPETMRDIAEDKNIVAVGFQADVRPFFAIAHALVFPSYREGFPNVVLQAGAMALPSIVTNINGCNEIITNQVNGLIIPAKNVDALHEAMQYCFSNSEFYKAAVKNARQIVEEKFKQQLVWNALLEEYKTIVETTKV